MLKDKIRLLRKKCGYTQKELADILHLSQQAIGKWENGISEPDSSTIVALSRIFDVSTDYLLDNFEGIMDTSGVTYHESLFVWFSARRKQLLVECLTKACADKGITPNLAVAQSGVQPNLFARLNSGEAGVCPPLDILRIAEYLSVREEVQGILNLPDGSDDAMSPGSKAAIAQVATQIREKSMKLIGLCSDLELAARAKKDAAVDKSGVDLNAASDEEFTTSENDIP